MEFGWEKTTSTKQREEAKRIIQANGYLVRDDMGGIETTAYFIDLKRMGLEAYFDLLDSEYHE